ncbi:elongation factor P maturation arginine rhamnosyltransferase EarP [Cetobacterium sp. 2A]|uniref:elongation factor P maturation arginine rhamnosyltransferase EarP n=1 Tax=Cetobacterium sp. 2A TaxID=2754723 RepID=UPI00163BF7EB|nr:elongation factor P maturation arginine rhamnosyltransferase EarP [Cetobacterium sp. 2A]MBC2856576.1 elongation factor P maturation arginine rhamnosyltransferase EarP [Cetobacterium sp. 2A]
MDFKTLDIFCEVIDNYGDIGVVYRIAKEFKKSFNDSLEIRVILNRLDEFIAINKNCEKKEIQNINGITYITKDFLIKNICTFETSDVIIEAFGCNIPNEYMEIAKEKSKLLINLEYLSAEDWIEDFHLQESPLGLKGLKKYFYMPGFTKKSGGLIVDSLFLKTKETVLQNKGKYLKKYLENFEIDFSDKLIGTVFSYEKNFTPLLESLKKLDKEVILLIMGEKSQQSFVEIFKNISVENFGKTYKYGKIYMKFMDFLNQEEYEEIINAVDFNFVRGEDSFVRALLTGKPFIWHAYLQDELVHMDKVEGFIERQTEYLRENHDIKVIEKQNKLLRDYNFRKENTLEIGLEEYDEFFKNFKELQSMYFDYSEFLISECNLINKIKKFIVKY